MEKNAQMINVQCCALERTAVEIVQAQVFVHKTAKRQTAENTAKEKCVPLNANKNVVEIIAKVYFVHRGATVLFAVNFAVQVNVLKNVLDYFVANIAREKNVLNCVVLVFAARNALANIVPRDAKNHNVATAALAIIVP